MACDRRNRSGELLFASKNRQDSILSVPPPVSFIRSALSLQLLRLVLLQSGEVLLLPLLLFFAPALFTSLRSLLCLCLCVSLALPRLGKQFWIGVGADFVFEVVLVVVLLLFGYLFTLLGEFLTANILGLNSSAFFF